MSDFEPRKFKTLVNLMSREPKIDGAGTVEQFVLRYIFFEAVLRELISGYRSAKAPRDSMYKQNESIRLDTVFKSLSHFAIAVPHEVIDALLNSKSNMRGSKSARNLRNALVHQWKAEDATEVELRGHELLGLLSTTVDAISSRILKST
jgi:hypothetical protein